MLSGLALIAGWMRLAGDEKSPPVAAGPVWREDFPATGDADLPKGWALRGKFGTPAAVFTVRTASGSTDGVLAMRADRATGSLVTELRRVDLRRTPILRWRWRVLTLPTGGDSRKPELDDQAIGIYFGAGTTLRKRSVSYRWDAVTPKGEQGDCRYGAGTILVRWFTLRGAEATVGEWQVEERNLAEDYQNAYQELPTQVYLSVSCNSQYTASKAEAELDWIELCPAAESPPPEQDPAQSASAAEPAAP